MIPTIDLSVWAALVGVGHFILKLWNLGVAARNWLVQHVILVVAGSRLWATVLFIGLSAFFILAMKRVILWAADMAMQMAWGPHESASILDDFAFINQFIPVERAKDFIALTISLVAGRMLILGNKALISEGLKAFNAFANSFKI